MSPTARFILLKNDSIKQKRVRSIKYIKQSLRNSLQRHTGMCLLFRLWYSWGCDTVFCCDELIITNLPVSQAINSAKLGITQRAQHICTHEISTNWTIFLCICVLSDICKHFENKCVCKTTHNSAHADTYTTPGVKAICPPISLSVAHHP